ncbi:MAG: transposase [Patescibacteria group bacterium]
MKEGKESGVKHPIGCLTPSISPLLKLIEFISYCLIPNHYHFILKQLIENGIEKFMHKLGTGYTNFFNRKYERTGSLFENTFKSIEVKSDNYLIYLSGYINGNIEIHKICKAENWPWSSYKNYLGLRKGTLCTKNIILNDFKNIEDYRSYVNIIIKESKQRKDDIKKYLLE